jgi:uncharacterized protein (DUF433 family)
MGITLITEAPPLRQDTSGGLRVGSSRVLLEVVIHAFEDGATPEIIVQRYPSMTLADVYGVIAYYLRHPGTVKAYLGEREQRADSLQDEIETHQKDLSALRTRLQSRRTSQ